MPNCFSLWDHTWDYDFQPLESCWPECIDDGGTPDDDTDDHHYPCVSYDFNNAGNPDGLLNNKIIILFLSASW